MANTYKPTKRERRLGIRVIPKLDKYVTRRPYPPGVHGQKRASALSDFGLQLREKQRVKFIYGIRERQLRRLFQLNPQEIMSTLERRLDNVVYRGGLALTRAQARQMVSHGQILVDGKKSTIPSLILNSEQKISPKKPDKINLTSLELPSWLEIDKKNKTIMVNKTPQRQDVTSEINDQLIIEYYSR